MKWLKKVASTPLTTISRVIDSLSNSNDRINAPSIRAVNDALAVKWETIFPVGSIYMAVNNINPSTAFGGTWVQIKDKFLLAAGDTYENGATGGSATTQYTPSGTVGGTALNLAQIPQHAHQYDKITVTGSTGTGSAQSVFATVDHEAWTSLIGRGEAHDHEFTGTAATLNNMPPYLAVKVWVRTA